MNVARRADGLLSAKQTIALLRSLERYPLGRQEENLLRDLAAFYPSIWSKGRNTIAFLCNASVLKERDGLISFAASGIEAQDWSRMLGKLVADALVRRFATDGAEGCLQANISGGGLWLDSMILPGVAEGLPLWIIEFAVADRERIGSRFWRVSETYEALFLDGARAANQLKARRSISAAQLPSPSNDETILASRNSR